MNKKSLLLLSVLLGIAIFFVWYFHDNGNKEIAKSQLDSLKNVASKSSSNLDLEYGDLNIGKTYFTFNKTAIYKDSSMSSAVLREMPANTAVKVLEKLASSDKINGVEFYWYKVSYGKQQGYMLAYDIAISHVALGNGYYCLMNIDSYSTLQEKFECRVKLVKNNVIEQELTFESFASINSPGIFDYLVDTKLLNQNKGLKGVKSIVEFDFSYDACLMNSGSHYVFWDGEKLYDGLSEFSMGDPSMSENTFLVFPNDKKGKIDTLYTYEKNCHQSEDMQSEVCEDSNSSLKFYVWKEGVGLE